MHAREPSPGHKPGTKNGETRFCVPFLSCERVARQERAEFRIFLAGWLFASSTVAFAGNLAVDPENPFFGSD